MSEHGLVGLGVVGIENDGRRQRRDGAARDQIAHRGLATIWARYDQRAHEGGALIPLSNEQILAASNGLALHIPHRSIQQTTERDGHGQPPVQFDIEMPHAHLVGRSLVGQMPQKRGRSHQLRPLLYGDTRARRPDATLCHGGRGLCEQEAWAMEAIGWSG